MVPLKCLNTPDSFIERRQVCDGIYGILAKVIQNCNTVGFRMVNFYITFSKVGLPQVKENCHNTLLMCFNKRNKMKITDKLNI